MHHFWMEGITLYNQINNIPKILIKKSNLI